VILQFMHLSPSYLTSVMDASSMPHDGLFHDREPDRDIVPFVAREDTPDQRERERRDAKN
jgi:hypothetical protein